MLATVIGGVMFLILILYYSYLLCYSAIEHRGAGSRGEGVIVMRT